MHDVRGKIALVTGASSGIGRAAAVTLARAGMRLMLTGRREAELAATAAAIRDAGGECRTAPADVAEQTQVNSLVAATLAHFGRIDVLVANAGIYVRGPFESLTAADFERSLQTNFYGSLYPVLAVLPHMRAQGSGHIVLVSSLDGKKGLPPDAPYVAAKFALAGVGEVLRQELHGTGVDVTTVFPGRVATPFIDNLEIPRISAPIPPEAVAAAILTAIKQRRAEVILPFTGRILLWVNSLSPRLGDWAVRVLNLGGWEKG